MKKKLMIPGLVILFISHAFAKPPADEGKLIFTSRCASCHNLNKVIVGPALEGVSNRHSEEWIIQFVHSSQTLIKSGDKAATALYEKFNKIPMPDHPDLTAENIKMILAYINSESKTPAQSPVFRPNKMHPSYKPILSTNWQFFTGYLVLVFMMAAAMILLVRVKEVERKETDKT